MIEEILIKKFEGEDFYTIFVNSKILNFEPKEINEAISTELIKRIIIESL